MPKKRENYFSIMFIRKVWRGEWPLVKTYWYLGVLLGIPFYAYLYYLEVNFESLTEMGAAIGIIFFIFYISYVIWINVSIWRSSTVYINEKNKKNLSAFWGYTAKVLVVISLLRASLEFVKGLIS